MALVLANRVQETGTANTTVSFTLAGAVTGFQSFAVIGNTNTTYYSATDGSGNWEVGLGTYSTTGPTLTRTTIYASSNSNLAVTFSGAVNVFVTYPSGKSINLDASGNVSALGTVSSGTWQGTTVGVAYGGTGVTSSSGANSVVLRDANQNITINRINQGLQTTTASGGTTTLTVASQFNQALVGTGGHTFKLPDATTLSDTTAFQFNNNATGTLTITNNAGTTVGTVASGGAAGIALLDNTTSNGTWDVHAYIPENVTWGTNALALGSTVITGGTWQGGTIQPAYGGTGLTTFTGANNALYSTGATTLTAGTLPMVAGGTGLSTIASTRIPYATATDTLGTSSGLTFNGSTFTATNISSNSSLTVTGAVTFNATSSTIQVSPSQITTTITIGGTTSATGTITLGRSTVSQTTDIQAGATASGSTKTINFGTGGLAGSTTTMAIGSTNGTTVTANGTWNYTGAITSTNASGILTRAAATQDGVALVGRAGGIGSFAVTLTPTTLSAARTLTLPDTSGTVITSGDTGTVTSTMILDGTIVNADINASAAIAVSKLAASTISGVTLGGTLATLTMNTSGTGLSGSTTYNGSGAATFTVTSNATNANTASTIVARDASGNFSAGTITATLSGNASTATSATSATTATNATNVAITDDTTTNATYYPAFMTATSGNGGVRVSSTKLTYNPSTGALSSTTVAGSSDERLKTNWRSLPNNFIEELAQVKAGIYDRTDHDVPITQVGVTAQSLQAVLPDAVISDDDGMLSVAYGNAALVSAIELAKRVVEQEARINRLEALVAKLIGD
jgi:hypothetical protein